MFNRKALTLAAIAMTNSNARFLCEPLPYPTVQPSDIKASEKKAQGIAKWKIDRERSKFTKKRK